MGARETFLILPCFCRNFFNGGKFSPLAIPHHRGLIVSEEAALASGLLFPVGVLKLLLFRLTPFYKSA